MRKGMTNAIPAGAVYTAEDIGNSSGPALDAIGARYNCPRGQKTTEKGE